MLVLYTVPPFSLDDEQKCAFFTDILKVTIRSFPRIADVRVEPDLEPDAALLSGFPHGSYTSGTLPAVPLSGGRHRWQRPIRVAVSYGILFQHTGRCHKVFSNTKNCLLIAKIFYVFIFAVC